MFVFSIGIFDLKSFYVSVCENVIEAAVSLVCVDELSFETLLHFIAAFPRESTDSGGK